ncbi:MAG: serine/threonine protein kinase [Lentisphaerae bacterium]|nr:serine/threonine protein kinase [Lentisphaerota bacterium]
MWFFSRKKSRPAAVADAPSSPAALARQCEGMVTAFESGRIPCPGCGLMIPSASLETLKMVECPKCQRIAFVPMRIGQYWLFEPLGGGGMGSVYKAVNRQHPSQLFAVKILSRAERTKPVNIHALLNEARIGQIVGNHPCLVKCTDSGCEDGEYYSAMELVQGERLDKRVDRLGRMPEREVLQMVMHLLSAEQHIYKCGYLYRDMKPENIIINHEGYAVLFDFGLCLPREQALHPQDEYVSGSPYYLPPERLLGTGEGAYSEIYSIGMVMYYALAGETFFDAKEVETLAKRHLSKVRLSVSGQLRDFRPELVEVLSRMIKQDPSERYQTFLDAAQAVEAILPTAPDPAAEPAP